MTVSTVNRGANPLSKQLLRYVITGLVNTGLGLLVILTMHLGFDVNVIASNAVGYGVGLLCSFTLNRSWTFESEKNILGAGLKYIVLIGIAFSLCLLTLTSLQSAGASYLAAQILGTALYSIIVFLGAKYVVFSN